MSSVVKLDTGNLETSQKSSGLWDRHSLRKRWPALLSEQKDKGLSAASIFIWKNNQVQKIIIIRKIIGTEEPDLHSPLCPVTILPEGKVLPPELCPKIHIKKWKLIWMVQMFDALCVCGVKQLPWLSFQIMLQVRALKYEDYLQEALILLAWEVWSIYSYTTGICKIRTSEMQY